MSNRNRTCPWHQYGVPNYAQGGEWAEKNCPMCQAKVASGKVPANAPTPHEFMLGRKHKRWDDRVRAAGEVAARQAHFATVPRPAKAM